MRALPSPHAAMHVKGGSNTRLFFQVLLFTSYLAGLSCGVCLMYIFVTKKDDAECERGLINSSRTKLLVTHKRALMHSLLRLVRHCHIACAHIDVNVDVQRLRYLRMKEKVYRYSPELFESSLTSFAVALPETLCFCVLQLQHLQRRDGGRLEDDGLKFQRGFPAVGGIQKVGRGGTE